MSKKIISVIFLVVSVIGVVVIINSVRWGKEAANSILSGAGGMDTSLYLVILERSIVSYQLLGAALLVIGGIGFIKIMKKLY
ncbi:hypothetical protein [Phosphitispora sp. TUW77]|uniref:hypothetical protein n=1 Tax=Phosphitispora sp. TUW77 TaxID=3152361 RepID=UPI003AB1E3CC